MKTLYTLVILLLSFHITTAAIIYTDVSPDLITIPSSTATFDVDVDNNSTPDFRFSCVDVTGLRFIIAQAGQIGLGNFVLEDTSGGSHFAWALAKNDAIAPNGVFWHAMSSQNPTLFSDFFGQYTGHWLNSQEYYLGVKFLIGSNFHYGWIRMQIEQSTGVVTLMDYAYEDQVNTAILAGALPGADVATNVMAIDNDETSSGLDMLVTFDKAANENTVDHYRIIVVKDSVSSFDLSNAQSLPVVNTYAVTPTGSNISTALHSSQLDADGDLVTIDIPYRVYVLSKADTTVIPDDGLSQPSPPVQLNTTADVTPLVECTDIANNGNSSDIGVELAMAQFEDGIQAYRLIIVKSDSAASFTLTDAESVQTGRYEDITPTGNNIQTTVSAGLQDFNGDPIAEDVPYKAIVMSVANGSVANINSLSGASQEFVLKDTATGVQGLVSPEFSFIVFPNPADDFVTLEFDSRSNAVDISLMDVSGREVLSLKGASADRNRVQLSASQLQPGLYLVRLSCAKGVVSKQLVVK